MERARSSVTVVAGFGGGSPSWNHPSSSACTRVSAKRPSALPAAPRPLIACGGGLSAMIPAYAGAVSPAGTALPLSMVVGVRGDSLLSGNSAGTRQAMVDKISAQARSKMMAGIRAKNTRPEMIVRRYLHSQGFRYRLHRKDLPGSPDVLLP